VNVLVGVEVRVGVGVRVFDGRKARGQIDRVGAVAPLPQDEGDLT